MHPVSAQIYKKNCFWFRSCRIYGICAHFFFFFSLIFCLYVFASCVLIHVCCCCCRCRCCARMNSTQNIIRYFISIILFRMNWTITFYNCAAHMQSAFVRLTDWLTDGMTVGRSILLSAHLWYPSACVVFFFILFSSFHCNAFCIYNFWLRKQKFAYACERARAFVSISRIRKLAV